MDSGGFKWIQADSWIHGFCCFPLGTSRQYILLIWSLNRLQWTDERQWTGAHKRPDRPTRIFMA